MATYNLEQQEQLDQVKHLWGKYGNLVTWVLVLVLGAYASWMYYQYWQAERALKAGGLYEELDKAASVGDAVKVGRAFSDLKNSYPGTTYAEQGALLAGRVLSFSNKADEGRAALAWAVENGKNANLVAIARLRLAGLLLDAKKFNEALAQVNAEMPAEFAALAQDRKGDILNAQGKAAEAVKAYDAAYKAMEPTVDYRRFVEAKLVALGHPPAAASAPQAATQP
jgi:predicted negative regulator of RcsB-dependent stress response